MKFKVIIFFLFITKTVFSQFNQIGIKLNNGNNSRQINQNNYPPNSSYINSFSKVIYNSFSATIFSEKIKEKKKFFRFNLSCEYSNVVQQNEWISKNEIENRISKNKTIQFIPSVELGKIIELDNLHFRFGVGFSINYNQNLKSSEKSNSSITNNSYLLYKEDYQNYKPNQFGTSIYLFTGIYYATKNKFSFGLEFTNGLNYQHVLLDNTIYVDKTNKITNTTMSYTTINNTKNYQFNTNLMNPSLVIIYKLRV